MSTAIPPRHCRVDTMGSAQELARDYLKSHGLTAKDVMTRDVIWVTDATELADVAMLLETKRIKRVPSSAMASSSVS
jgi:CBS-domain-containing membrane protein